MKDIIRLIVSDNITLADVKEFIIDSFDKGIRAINIFQGNKIVLFDETGNFNILVTKYNGNEITAIAVNHWNGNLYSIVFDKLADKFTWQQINTPNHKMLQSMNNYFNINDSNCANILLYKFSEENWGGIGIEPDGTLAIRVGTSNMYRRIFRFKANADSIEISDH